MAVETGTPPSQVPPESAEPASAPENAPQTPPSGSSPTPEAPSGPEDERHLSREQTNYRRRMKAAEEERDSLREERDSLRAQLDRVQTAEVERLASAAGLAVGGDVWQFGATLDTLRGDTGDIAGDTVKALVLDILRDRPGLRAQVGRIGIGRGASAAGSMNGPRVGLSSLLKP